MVAPAGEDRTSRQVRPFHGDACCFQSLWSFRHSVRPCRIQRFRRGLPQHCQREEFFTSANGAVKKILIPCWPKEFLTRSSTLSLTRPDHARYLMLKKGAKLGYAKPCPWYPLISVRWSLTIPLAPPGHHLHVESLEKTETPCPK